MNINRIIALAAIVLLAIGAMGAVSMRAYAQSNQAPAAQSQTCDQQNDDPAQVQDALDTDNVELECGDQNAANEQETVEAADTDNIEEQVGDQNEADGSEVESADGQDNAPVGTPSIPAEVAQKTAETYLNAGTATKVELGDENGKLVYSVEIGTTDVKVDAMTGSVLGTEAAED
ncbi:MAG: PepSY domain-containing protein [Chloroflexota bacterium]